MGLGMADQESMGYTLHKKKSMDNLTFSEEEVFDRIVEEGLMQGIATEEEYHTLVEEVIDDMLRMGELDEEQNIEGHLAHLRARFGEFERRVHEGV